MAGRGGGRGEGRCRQGRGAWPARGEEEALVIVIGTVVVIGAVRPPRRAASAVHPLVVRILRELGRGDDVLLSAGAAAWPEAKRSMTSASVA